MPQKDTCFMLVSGDKYQLPLADADSIHELAELTGLSATSLRISLNNGCLVKLPKGKFTAAKGFVIQVELEEDSNGT